MDEGRRRPLKPRCFVASSSKLGMYSKKMIYVIWLPRWSSWLGPVNCKMNCENMKWLGSRTMMDIGHYATDKKFWMEHQDSCALHLYNKVTTLTVHSKVGCEEANAVCSAEKRMCWRRVWYYLYTCTVEMFEWKTACMASRVEFFFLIRKNY